MQVAIELRLPAMQFNAGTFFKPTTLDMVLKEKNERKFDQAMRVRKIPGHISVWYEYMGYSSI